MEGKINRLKLKKKVSPAPHQSTESPEAELSIINKDPVGTTTNSIVLDEESPAALTSPAFKETTDNCENKRRQHVQDQALKTLADILHAVDRNWKPSLKSLPDLPPYVPPPALKEDIVPTAVSMESGLELPPLPKICPCKLVKRRKGKATMPEQSSDPSLAPETNAAGVQPMRPGSDGSKAVQRTSVCEKKISVPSGRQDQERLSVHNYTPSTTPGQSNAPHLLSQTSASLSKSKIRNTTFELKRDSQPYRTASTAASKSDVSQHTSKSRAFKTASSGLFSKDLRICEDDADKLEGTTNVHRVSNFPDRSAAQSSSSSSSSSLGCTSNSKTSNASVGLLSTNTKIHDSNNFDKSESTNVHNVSNFPWTNSASSASGLSKPKVGPQKRSAGPNSAVSSSKRAKTEATSTNKNTAAATGVPVSQSLFSSTFKPKPTFPSTKVPPTPANKRQTQISAFSNKGWAASASSQVAGKRFSGANSGSSHLVKVQTSSDRSNCGGNLSSQGREPGQSGSGYSSSDRLKSCPLCQAAFSTALSQMDIDGHIAACLSANDEDIVW